MCLYITYYFPNYFYAEITFYTKYFALSYTIDVVSTLF